VRSRLKPTPSPGSSGTDIKKPFDFEQARRETALLNALTSNPAAVLRSKKFRETIRCLDNRSHNFKHAGGNNQIADILCAAEFWAQNEVQVRESRLPFNALNLRDFYQRDLKYHRYFKRQTRKILPVLRQYQELLRDCDVNSTGYQTCRELCEQIIVAIENRAAEEPSLHGTRAHDPSRPQPHSWAGAEIFRVLRRKRWKKESALARSAELLAVIFPALRTRNANGLKDSIWQAYQRSRRRYGVKINSR
jgi:hypothetical protein